MMMGNKSPWLGQVPLVRRSWLGQFDDIRHMQTLPPPPSQPVIQCKQGADCPSAFCLTIGPVSAPDLDKVRAQLQAKPSGTFWIYPKTAMGPGDQDYVVWCNAYSTPVPGSVVWAPPSGLISAPDDGAAGTAPGTPPAPGTAPAAPAAAAPAPASSGTALAVGGGLAAASLLAFLAFR